MASQITSKDSNSPESGKASPPARPAARSNGTAADAAKAAPKESRPVTASQSTAVTSPGALTDDEPREGTSRFLLFNAVPSWLVSMTFHAIVLLILAVITLPGQLDRLPNLLTVQKDLVNVEEIMDLPDEVESLDVESMSSEPVFVEVPSEVQEAEVTVNNVQDVSAAATAITLSDFGERTAPKNNLASDFGSFSGSGLAGRGAAARGQMLSRYGGNEESEAAVALALQWLAQHQLPNGAWSFDHRTGGKCNGRCSQAGTLATGFNGATGLALLPFLGAGQTHKEGKYKETVARGLYYLLNSMKVKNGPRGELSEAGGSMYSHGICSIVLCEAYAMTHDKQLMQPAQLALNHIVYAQDPIGGGWRYQPRTPGDTSVVGWQLMALKSGHMAYLLVPKETIIGANKFLDSVQSDYGAQYGYTGPGRGSARTAVGLLCRMYLGWDRDNPALQRGVQLLSDEGPSSGNMYYNYYATQVMRHYEGDTWTKWNDVMRDQLVDTQSKEGHMTGSWFMPRGDHGADRGGRLYCTAMATMILEVYYRHMPIYGKQAAEEEFPL